MAYIHSDHLNTSKVVTDSNQQVVWKGDYTPFGEVEETVSTIGMPSRFPGQYEDEETELNYNYFRTYDPQIGRYTQSDPIGLHGGLNTFLYVSNNPNTGFDPKGLVRWKASYAGGSLILFFGAGFHRFSLVSDCIAGVRAKAVVWLVGSGMGGSIGFTTIGVDIEENLEFVDYKEMPDPDVFNGQGGMAAGGISSFPNSWGLRSIRLGNADYVNGTGKGMATGIEIGGAVITGSSTVMSSSVEECCND